MSPYQPWVLGICSREDTGATGLSPPPPDPYNVSTPSNHTAERAVSPRITPPLTTHPFRAMVCGVAEFAEHGKFNPLYNNIIATPLQSDSPMGVMARREEPVPDHTHLDTRDGCMDMREEAGSVSSDDSFHSTVEEAFDGTSLSMSSRDNQLYMSAQELVRKGGVQCRIMRLGI